MGADVAVGTLLPIDGKNRAHKGKKNAQHKTPNSAACNCYTSVLVSTSTARHVNIAVSASGAAEPANDSTPVMLPLPCPQTKLWGGRYFLLVSRVVYGHMVPREPQNEKRSLWNGFHIYVVQTYCCI